MKTVMKKLLSLALVAMLLVSAVPFQAAAAETDYAMSLTFFASNGQYKSETQLAAVSAEEVEEWREMAGTYEDEDVAQWVNTYLGGAGEYAKVEVTVRDDIQRIIVKFTEAAAEEPPVTPPAQTPDEDEDDDTTAIVPPSSGNEEEAQEVVIYVDYTDGAEGEPARAYTHKKVGDTFGDILPASPQRNTMTFKQWTCAATGAKVTANTVITEAMAEDGVIDIYAVWNVRSLFLTLDENRGEEETVNRGIAVYYGEPIGRTVNGKFVGLHTPTREGYTFSHWELNGKKITNSTIYELGDDATAYAIWTQGSIAGSGSSIPEEDGKVWLEIYVNGKTGELEKRVDITSLLKDEKITRDEVKKVVNKYVTAKSGYSLKYEGLFDEESWYWYCRDPETDGVESITIETLKGEIYEDHYIYVMVNNVKTVAADSTNPKTGDMIFASMATMSTTAAAAYVMLANKKRLVK